MTHVKDQRPRAAEFFAGIGLVGLALERSGFQISFANDVDPVKRQLFSRNFPHSVYELRDVRTVRGEDVPDVELATASFPCTDLSLAGNRAGLTGRESGMFWEFARVVEEMGERRPTVVMLENVVGFATSHGGRDLRAALLELGALGYVCDLLVLDARWYVPQSRPRLFIVGAIGDVMEHGDWRPSSLRPEWISRFVAANPDLDLRPAALPEPPRTAARLSAIVEQLPSDDPAWWGLPRRDAFLDSLSPLQRKRLEGLRQARQLGWRTAYRRTRHGTAVWEIRADDVAGCLRTARGGSSKQALVEAGVGEARVRWLTPREYARLQGAPDFRLGDANPNQAYFAFGDAVCVPAVAWLAEHYLRPLVERQISRRDSIAAHVAV